MDAMGHSGRLPPRLVVLAFLIVGFGWVLILPWAEASPPTPMARGLLLGGLLLFGLVMVLALWTAVTRDPVSPYGGPTIALLVTITLALWWPLYTWAKPGEVPWAWLAGLAVAVAGLVTVRAGVATAAGLTVAAAVGGFVHGGSVTVNVLITLGGALIAWVMGQVAVWLLRLLAAATAGRQAEAELAVAEERLRVSRELHDVLGHRLGVIALKAELAADLAARDPGRSASESEQIRALSAETLAEARRAVQGDTVADLAAQLGAAELVLTSAGIEAELQVNEELLVRLPAPVSRVLAMVVREAVTNVLRHSDARHVSVTLTGDPATPAGTSSASTEGAAPVTLVVRNDGVRAAGPTPEGSSGGTGLAALAARCSAADARLVARRVDEDRFEVRVDTLPGGPPA